MTRSQALAKARRQAMRRKDWVYVVVDDIDDGYEVASDFDLETFYLGAPVVLEVGPDGQVVPGH